MVLEWKESSLIRTWHPSVCRFALIIGLSVLAACGGGGGGGSSGSRGTDNIVEASVSPTGMITGYTGEAQSVSVTFTTNDGAMASALTLSGLGALPAGWMSSAAGFTCASVATGNSCALTLTYTPPAPGSGTLTLSFSYMANDGAAKTGTITVPFTARSIMLDLLAGSAGGAGNLDGIGNAARFDAPTSVVADSAGNVYVADGNGGLLRKITPDRRVTTILRANSGPITVQPPLSFGALAIDAADNLYIADSDASRILELSSGGVLTTLAGNAFRPGAADGTGTAASFNYPSAIAVNAVGTVYVAEGANNEIRQITPAGVVTTLAGSIQSGSVDGTGSAARFWRPSGIAVNTAGMVYVSDTENSTIRQITPQGVVSTLAGIVGDYAWADGSGKAAAFDLPMGMSVDIIGNLYVADNVGLIRKSTPQGVVTTPLGTPGKLGSADGTGPAASFMFPPGPGDVTAVPGDVLYVADTGNNTIRMASSQDVVTTIAGLANSSQGPVPSLGLAIEIAADAAGNIYLAEDSVVKISPQGVITPIAPQTPLAGSVYGVAIGADGTIYVSEHTSVQKISPQGVVTTLGAPGMINTTTAGIAVNSAGTVYVPDSDNNRIIAITPQGVSATLAGDGMCCGSVDGTGTSARFNSPYSITLDTAGNLFVGEYLGVIRKITPQGVVTTLPLASAALPFSTSSGTSNLAFDKSDNLYVADEYNHVIRKITPQGAVTTVIGAPARVGIALSPLPASLANPKGVVVLPSGQLAILDGPTVLVTQGL